MHQLLRQKKFKKKNDQELQNGHAALAKVGHRLTPSRASLLIFISASSGLAQI